MFSISLHAASVGEDTKRVKMFLTTSKLADKNYGAAVQQLKTRLGLNPNDKDKDLGFLRNTCMEPYQASELYVTRLGDIFRTSVLNCIGAVCAKLIHPLELKKFLPGKYSL